LRNIKKGSVDNTWVKFSLKKMVRKKGGGGEVFREPLGGGSDFLGVCEGTIGCI
jgi:hypothetical protein